MVSQALASSLDSLSMPQLQTPRVVLLQEGGAGTVCFTVRALFYLLRKSLIQPLDHFFLFFYLILLFYCPNLVFRQVAARRKS